LYCGNLGLTYTPNKFDLTERNKEGRERDRERERVLPAIPKRCPFPVKPQ
jgi:hypothetical protein